MGRRPPMRVALRNGNAPSATTGVSGERQRHGTTPRARIQQAARGEQQLAVDDLNGLLAEHLLGADGHTRQLVEHREVLLRMITDSATKQGPADLLAALDAIARIDNLERASRSELRRTAELLWRMSGPTRPRIDVVGSGENQVSVRSRSS